MEKNLVIVRWELMHEFDTAVASDTELVTTGNIRYTTKIHRLQQYFERYKRIITSEKTITEK